MYVSRFNCWMMSRALFAMSRRTYQRNTFEQRRHGQNCYKICMALSLNLNNTLKRLLLKILLTTCSVYFWTMIGQANWSTCVDANQNVQTLTRVPIKRLSDFAYNLVVLAFMCKTWTTKIFVSFPFQQKASLTSAHFANLPFIMLASQYSKPQPHPLSPT